MPRHLELRTRTDAVVAAAHAIIVREGVRGLTLRGVAAEARLSPATLAHHFGNRERLERVLARTVGWRRAEDRELAAHGAGAAALLPQDDDAVEDARVWLAWREVARANPTLVPAMGGLAERERELVSQALVSRALVSRALGPADEIEVDLALAVLAGLADLCCDPGDPWSPERCRTVWRRLWERVPGQAIGSRRPV